MSLSSGPSGSETILVVDDEASVLSITSAILARGGYKILQASSGAQALEICSKQESGVNLLLTDVMMPNMSGPQLADRLLANHPDMNVLFMSGYDDYQLEKYRPFAFKRFMRKPFTPAALLTTVRETLDEPRKREPGRQAPNGDIQKAHG